MGRKVKVPLFGATSKAVVLDAEATEGATLGVNLRRADGSLVTEADLGGTEAAPSRTWVLWELIQKVPANVRALASLATDGWIRRDGAAITSRELAAVDSSYDPTDSGMSATNVQTAIDELDAQKIPDAPSDGTTYGRKNAAWVNVGSGGSGLTLMGSATVAGSAATDMTVSSLDLASDGAYLVLVNIGNATASSATISLFYNGDTTQTNYYYQFWAGNGAASQASRTNLAALVGLAASSSANGKITVMPDILSGYPRAIIQINRNAPSSIDSIHAAHIRNDGANVTSLTISSSVASSLAVGSYVKVYKLG